MKKEYFEPALYLLELDEQDVITMSPGDVDGDNPFEDDFS